jgi:hypothetical protein
VDGGFPLLDETLRSICFADSQQYDPKKLAESVSSVFRDLPSSRLPLVSMGALTSQAHDRKLKGIRLQELFPQASIIMTIRRPEDLIMSLYFNRLQFFWKKTNKIVGLEAFLNQEWENKGLSLTLQYARIFDLYRVLFGKANCLLLFFEDLIKDKSVFSRQLSEFLEIDANITSDCLSENRNPRMNTLKYTEIRVSHRFPLVGFAAKSAKQLLPRSLKTALARIVREPARETLPAYWRQRIRDYARAENSSLAAEFPQIEAYDYF